MRAIDADAFREDLMKLWDYSCVDGITATTVLKQVIHDLDNAPTVEERPIRCKDCKYTVLSKTDGKTLICCLTRMIGTVRPDFYCGNGEMKGGKEE